MTNDTSEKRPAARASALRAYAPGPWALALALFPALCALIGWLWMNSAQVWMQMPPGERSAREIPTVLSWSDDGKELLGGGVGGEVARWDAATGALIGSPLRGPGPVRALRSTAAVFAGATCGAQALFDAPPSKDGVRSYRMRTVFGALVALPFETGGSKAPDNCEDVDTSLPLVAADGSSHRYFVIGTGKTFELRASASDPNQSTVLTISSEAPTKLEGLKDGIAVGLADGTVWKITPPPKGSTAVPAPARLPADASGSPVDNLAASPLSALADNKIAALTRDGMLTFAGAHRPIAGPARLAAQFAPGPHVPVNVFAALSPDGSRLVAGSYDHAFRVFDAATLTPIGAPMAHGDNVLGAAFDKQGARILSWSEDHTLRLWDAATGRPIVRPMRHDDVVFGARFSGDGRRILSWSADWTLRVWDAATGVQLGPSMKHENSLQGAEFSRDERRILSWSNDHTMRMWYAATGAQIGPSMKHDDWVEGARFSRDETRILSWSGDTTVRLWDAATGAQIGPSMKHDDIVWDAQFSRDERRILSWSGRTVRLWDAGTGAQIAPSMVFDGIVRGAQFSQNERSILSWSFDKTARLWNAATGAQIGASMQHDGPVAGALFSIDERRMLTWSDDRTARVWDVATGAQIGPAMSHDAAVVGAMFLGDGRSILTWSQSGDLRIWRPSFVATRLALSDDGESLMILWQQGSLSILRAASPPAQQNQQPQSDPPWDRREIALPAGVVALDAALSPDGSRVVAALSDNSVRAYDVSRTAEWAALRGHKDARAAIALSPDGAKLAVADLSGRISITDLSRARAVAIWEAPFRRMMTALGMR